MLKRIAILGSTGSIGKQAIEVVENNPELFKIEVLTANSNAELLIEQAKKIKPKYVVIADERHYKNVKNSLAGIDITVLSGNEQVAWITTVAEIDFVIIALVGYSGLLPTIKALEANKQVALANKEALVVAGDIITELAHKKNIQLLPIDSEHSAIFQCLTGENIKNIEKIYLTASGGPFRGYSKEQLKKVTKNEALNHPNWTMGAKITIDSATMMNKGLEMIEAKWLFDLKPDQIDVVVHSQSIIHSIVQFCDGSMKAQMGLPDMKLPIQFAMSYPDRIFSDFERFDFKKYPVFNFEQPDFEVFKCLKLALLALQKGGNIPCILNAANEIAVDLFLREKINFLQISEIIEKTIDKFQYRQNLTLEEYIETDTLARKYAKM
ncbi:MAG TPA: 1-deoxy-D-xylulose-5-phosphate reductoisomerase [Bacteroidetes bacterium]|nr:1-deoxy-D-xylulose-5-phosphate reductoisomerase [Bacteroidota bacterium]